MSNENNDNQYDEIAPTPSSPRPDDPTPSAPRPSRPPPPVTPRPEWEPELE